jgi:hypothetical protein|tara:strand:+ start:484 stop:663 length:180 start_codon:yes stop_codon:yes gene_type:complete
MTKKIQIGDKKFVVDGDTFMEQSAYNKYQERLKTVFKVGGKLSDVRGAESPFKKHEQKD